MALIAINAVVHIPADARVVEIGRVPAPVTGLGAREDRIVRGIGVAGSTHRVGVAMSFGEPGMVKHRAGPGRCRVAGGTRCGEPGCRVNWIRCAVVIYRVAAVAIGWQRRVVVVHVAQRAGHGGVKTGQRESRSSVIERRASPVCRRVAEFARLREPGGCVSWIRCAIEVSQMAGDAGSYGDAVVVVDVATGAGNGSVKTSQREARRCVIKYRSRPGCGRVANGTVCRERSRNMVWHRASERCGALPGSEMASVAGR